MASKIEICNMALGNAGISKSIASIDEASNEARACKTYYDQAIKEVLRALPWPFATGFVQLALVEEQPNANWYYSYRYPSDCAAVRRVIPYDVAVDDNYRDPFVIASDPSGRLIFSNQVTAMAEITKMISDPLLFDEGFINSMSWLLAKKVAPQLTGNNYSKVLDRVERGYAMALSSAGASAMNEGDVSTAPYCETMAARE